MHPALKRLALRLLIHPLVTRLSSPLLVSHYLRTHSARKLHLGGAGLTGWLNTDLFPTHWRTARLDATRQLPFADATFEFVFSEHMIEHVPLDAARRMLAESFRVLRPGGWIRIATPDLARIVRFYTDPDTPAHQRYFNRIVGSFALAADRPPRTTVVNSLFFLHGHRFIFDEAALATLFRQVGFTDLRRCEPDVSEVPDLRGIHQHHYAIGVEANALETLVLEARRP